MELRVHPTLIPQRRLIANVNGVMNAVLVNGDAVGPTLYYGAGAGAEATASAVIADIVDVARTLDAKPDQRVPAAGVALAEQGDTLVLPEEEVVTSYYLRISAHDKPGVMSKVATICSDQGISIEALIQHEPVDGEELVPVVILTSRAREACLREAVAQIEALDTVEGKWCVFAWRASADPCPLCYMAPFHRSRCQFSLLPTRSKSEITS